MLIRSGFLTLCLLVLMFAGGLSAQTGGSSAYSFLTLSNSPRTAAMGGLFLTISDHDPFIGAANPSLITEDMHNVLGLNFIDYFAGINGGSIAYGLHSARFGSYVASIDFLDYGEFTEADATGQVLGTFTARDMSVNLGWGRPLADHYAMGAGLKIIYSTLETYSSVGIGVDLSGSWFNDDRSTVVSVLANNMGAMITSYVPGGEREPLPFRLRMGISRKPQHVPFRFSFILDDLQQWDLSYDDPTNPNLAIDPATGEPLGRSKAGEFTDNALRHLVVGGEFTPFERLAVRVGYNYRRRQEMKVSSRTAMIGFSWGLGLNLSRFRFDFARMNYHLAGSYNMFSVSTNLSDFGTRRKIRENS